MWGVPFDGRLNSGCMRPNWPFRGNTAACCHRELQAAKQTKRQLSPWHCHAQAPVMAAAHTGPEGTQRTSVKRVSGMPRAEVVVEGVVGSRPARSSRSLPKLRAGRNSRSREADRDGWVRCQGRRRADASNARADEECRGRATRRTWWWLGCWRSASESAVEGERGRPRRFCFNKNNKALGWHI